MGKKVEQARRPTSQAGPVEVSSAEDGFTLLEVVCVVAIISIIAAIILPALPRGTPRARIEAYALETASLLKADRHAAGDGSRNLGRCRFSVGPLRRLWSSYRPRAERCRLRCDARCPLRRTKH